MQTKSLIVMVDVDRTAELYEPSPEERKAVSQGRGTQIPKGAIVEYRSIEEVATMRDEILVPSHIPDGFTFRRAMSIGNYVDFMYIKGKSNKFVALSVSQNKLLPGHQIQWHVAPGSYEAVTVSGRPGYFIRGSWLNTPRSGGLRLKEWAEHIQKKVMFEGPGNQVIEITVNPGSGLDDASLLRIAESLQPY